MVKGGGTNSSIPVEEGFFRKKSSIERIISNNGMLK